MNIIYIIICAFIFNFVPVNTAFAHKVIVFAWVEEGMIHTESQFGSKRKAIDSAIIVTDEKGQILHEGVTDAQGNYSFKIPESIESDLIITLKAGIGHQGQWRIPKADLIQVPSKDDIKASMKEKQNLEASPSILKIFAGIAIIFSMALVIKFVTRKKGRK